MSNYAETKKPPSYALEIEIRTPSHAGRIGVRFIGVGLALATIDDATNGYAGYIAGFQTTHFNKCAVGTPTSLGIPASVRLVGPFGLRNFNCTLLVLGSDECSFVAEPEGRLHVLMDATASGR